MTTRHPKSTFLSVISSEDAHLTVTKKIKKVVFVNPPIKKEQIYGQFSAWGCNSLPTGMCSIAAFIREKGYDVAIVDGEALQLGIEGTISAVLNEKPDMVGITCKSLWMINAHKVAEELRIRIPQVTIVAGGNHVTGIPERTLFEFPRFDILVLGEGELTMWELLESLNSNGDLRSVNGLAFLSDGKPYVTPKRERITDLDMLPFPAWDLLPDLMKYYQPSLLHVDKLPAFTLITTRGCPRRCTFCDRSIFENRVTTHSPEYILKMMAKIHQEYGVKYFVFDDDDFLLKPTHVKRFAELLKAANLGIHFTCSTRVDSPCIDLLPMLKEVGLTQVLLGVESGNQEILDAMKKDITLDKTRRMVAALRKARIKSMAFIILGYPGETVQSMEDTVNFMKQTNFDDVGVWIYTPLPGSEIYDQIKNRGAEWGTYHEDWELMNSIDGVVFVPKGLTHKIIEQYAEKVYNACYITPMKLLKMVTRFYTFAHMKAILITIPKMLFGTK